jgi:hypothetical protein
MRRLGTFLAVVLLAQAAAAVAAGGPGLKLDKRFGRDGAVHLDPHVPGQRESFPEGMAGTGNGGFFVLEGATKGSYLVRYGRTGARDRAFGYVPVSQRPDPYAEAGLAVDTAGRPLVYRKEGDDVVVTRFTRRGRVDRSFADRGRFVLRCGGCYPNWLLALPRGRVLLVAEGNDRTQRHYKGSIPVLVRLRRDGGLDRSFGVNGVAHLRLHGRFSPQDFVAEPGGGVVFSGDTYGLGLGPYVARLRADGKLDRRFGRAARRAVERLPKDAEVLFGHGLVGHRDGTVDLYGDLGFGDRAFVLRLDRHGSLARSFGSGGMKAFRWGLGSVGSDGRDGAIALVYKAGHEFAYRLGPEVRTAGVPRVAFWTGEQEGVWIEAQRGGTAMVFDFGFDSGCRQTCGTWVQVVRLRLAG